MKANPVTIVKGMRSALRLAAAVTTISAAFLGSPAAEAYVGPGAGMTMLGALWAVFLAVLFALAGLLIWPIRLLRRRLASKKAGETGAAAPEDTHA